MSQTVSSGESGEPAELGDSQVVLHGQHWPSILDAKSDRFWAGVLEFQEGSELLRCSLR